MKKPGAVSRPGAQPTVRNKKPIAGRPGIGAQFVSFNFANTLIRAMTSSIRSSGLPLACPPANPSSRRRRFPCFSGTPCFDRYQFCQGIFLLFYDSLRDGYELFSFWI
jgi:hypothetical protein